MKRYFIVFYIREDVNGSQHFGSITTSTIDGQYISKRTVEKEFTDKHRPWKQMEILNIIELNSVEITEWCDS